LKTFENVEAGSDLVMLNPFPEFAVADDAAEAVQERKSIRVACDLSDGPTEFLIA
jgi:hypothetical protein